MRTGGGGDRRGHFPPAGFARFGLARAQGGAQHGAGGLFQIAQGDGADAVLAVDHLALFGQAQVAVDRSPGCGDDRAPGLAAAARQRTAAAMEEGDAHASFGSQCGQRHLGLLQRPARGHQATVLGAVGIAQHHHLAVTAAAQVLAIHGVGEQRTQGVGGVVEVVDGFKQWRHVQRHRAVAVDAATQLGQRQHRQRVGGASAHRDDVGADGARAVARQGVGDGAEDVEHGTRVVGVELRSGGRVAQECAQDFSALGPITVRVRVVAQQRGQGGVVLGAFLAQVQRRQVEAEGLHAAQQAAHGETAGVFALVRLQAGFDQAQVGEEIVRARVAIAGVRVGGADARRQQSQEAPIGHVRMPGLDRFRRVGKTQRVLVGAFDQDVIHAHAALGLA